MPQPEPIPFARSQINDVRRQLLDAAAFGKHLRPEQLENMAGKLAEGLRAYAEAMAPAQPPADGRACLDYRNRAH
ncbi:DUF6374 family protein [Nocardia abscessus]|uniref:DUF6374 family protein n=1 Tax=Nocardia abscessus TaxID=120957 RepID=UPI00245602DE|nr:DUF6374 family protein [Nocardia abscessus]